MENDIPSIFIKIGKKNYKASLDFEQVMGLSDVIERTSFLRNQEVLTLAEKIELIEGFLTFINVALMREYPQLSRAQLADILTTTNVIPISEKIFKMILCAYSDRPEERNLNGCKIHLKLVKKEQNHG